MSGASGAVYGHRLLEELLRDEGLDVHLIISPAARQILKLEEDLDVDLARFSAAALGLASNRRLVYHRYDDLAAPPSSGSFEFEAMAIAPCSMGCAAAIAHGLAADLIQRAAAVTLKERRKLVLVPRETPLSAVHLENLLTLAKLGAVVLPASPGFYGRPQTVAALVDFIVGRVLDHLGVKHRLLPRWGERETRREAQGRKRKNR
jgi:4-hydroxy-3-polyprenylbenzoate decarboxylase